jgi:hypothetical protein
MYAHLDPLFGLDFFVAQARAFTNFTRLPILKAAFAHYGATYAVRRFGEYRSLETCDVANIRAAWADRSGAWDVAPTRLVQMEQFCERGLINADGRSTPRPSSSPIRCGCWRGIRRRTERCAMKCSAL